MWLTVARMSFAPGETGSQTKDQGNQEVGNLGQPREEAGTDGLPRQHAGVRVCFRNRRLRLEVFTYRGLVCGFHPIRRCRRDFVKMPLANAQGVSAPAARALGSHLPRHSRNRLGEDCQSGKPVEHGHSENGRLSWRQGHGRSMIEPRPQLPQQLGWSWAFRNARGSVQRE